MIWEYNEMVANDVLRSYKYNAIKNCPYCHYELFHLGGIEIAERITAHGFGGDYGPKGHCLQVCQKCGWWVITSLSGYSHGSYEGSLGIKRGCGCLMNVDEKRINQIPIDELRKYLIANYQSKNSMNGRRFEEVVEGIFEDFGYDVILTDYTKDFGIDLILLEDNIGIQVKRHKNRIEAEHIRAFAGALVLNKMTKGIYVTTSEYRRGALQAAIEYGKLDLEINLVNSAKVYDALNLSQRKVYESADDDTAGYYKFWKNIDLLPSVYSHSW